MTTHGQRRSLQRRSVGIAALLAVLTAGACSDASPPSGPASDLRASPGVQAARAAAQGTTHAYVESPFEFEGEVANFSCLDEPAFFHVRGLFKVTTTTTSSGIVSILAFFAVDRPNTWIVYNGLTYTVAQGRQTGQDDIGHTLIGTGDLYIDAGVEPDFEVAETGERLRLNFTWHTVIDRNGTVRVSGFSGNCPPV
jgi:hypothetical protein